MSFPDTSGEEGHVHLNDEDIAYLMNVLRNATQPVTTQQLIDVLRRQSSQFHEAAGTTDESSA
jgi:hypothetical protein